MGRAHESFSKKEVRTRQEKKRKEKEKKRTERKENKGGSGLDDMIAYVDEFGNISSTPKDPSERKAVNLEDITIGVQRNLQQDARELVNTGVVTFFDTSKGFGFIRDLATGKDIFVHVNDLLEPIKENQKVTFDTIRGLKGLNAKNVKVQREENRPEIKKD